MKLRDDIPLRRRVAEEAARAAGQVHLKHRGRDLQRTLHYGDRTDFATRVDYEAQDAVREVVRRYRELLRQAHPDHGAQTDGAAQRIADLTEARRILTGR